MPPSSITSVRLVDVMPYVDVCIFNDLFVRKSLPAAALRFSVGLLPFVKIRLLEVLQNLLDNAVRFMGDQPEPHIKVASRFDNGNTVCYVEDNGIGIAKAYQEQVFGLFNRLNTTVDGTGIGLALVKRIIEMHGGSIWIESEGDGHGSTFCFTLPE